MEGNDIIISVVVPMYYEEMVAKECYKQLTDTLEGKEFDYELIFVNDGSKDKTEDILLGLAKYDKRVRVINFSRNFGHQTAVTAGIFNAKGDAVVIIDADLQDPPKLILDMINLWKKGYDVVYGKRKKRNGETFFKLLTAKYFYKFLNYMSDIDIPKDTGDFRLIDKKVAQVFKNMPEKNRFVRGMMSWIGFNQTFIEYERDERFAGETKYPLKKMIKFATDGIVSFSTKPLKIVSFLGLLSIVLSIVIFLYSIISKIFIHQTIAGWASIVDIIAFFGGLQLISLGIVGEYVARIYEESKNRPLYIIKSTKNLEDEDRK
ncbi:dolichol-phosphate mannosyltransferase [Clostridium acidisoli DSM 12555]|uniref:Dolichol-phosphate mannosyltransferase n=1 Tax=Clostridium acidisoli DSM 12555 TaxID=1121291 RepID=A0A1W1XBE4_9CLOT|nr:glycosyltransferase family 2 protein [Clostridium acidisoli]SMC21173.1 dolichol-phosphate mannosyltransferase [Clostridium acidisoli DSM 12555]